MLPDFVMHAIVQELPKTQLDRLVRKAGFDPDNLFPPLRRELHIELPYGGEFDFNLTVGALSESHGVPCRIVWTADLADYAASGERILGQIHCSAHALGRADDGDRLEWSTLDFGLLPRAAIAAIDEHIEEQAKLQERAAKSGS